MREGLREEKTLNEWLRTWGFTWVDGREQLYKGSFNMVEANEVVRELHLKGDIQRGR